MHKKAALLLAPGFEEAEALIVVDILRRLKVEVDMLACQPSLDLTGYWGISVRADAPLEACAEALYDAVILPGGPQGARNLGANPAVLEFIRRQQAAQGWICSICSAGAHVLAANGLLQGRQYVCSGDAYKLYADGEYRDQPIVEDGRFLTGKGLGYAFEFALAIGVRLKGPEIVRELAGHIYLTPEIVNIAVGSVPDQRD